ncbi:MAG: hypothetical protein EBU46_00560 [Nitrosomonadaceae bacterium]|nr:hypothetical protein [Nitrosomonadaceae bacterium]
MKHSLSILVVCLALAVGCTYFRPSLEKVKVNIEERSKELNSGANLAAKEAKEEIEKAKLLLNTADVPTNAASPVTITQPNFKGTTNHIEKASTALGVTVDMTRRNENLIGKPVIDQTPIIAALLSENKMIREAAELRERGKELNEQMLIAKVEALERKLIEYGTKYEQERNDKITTWFKWGGGIALLLFVMVGLPILFPPLASFVVGIFPALTSIFNIPASMGKNLVKGIGEHRWQLQKQAEMETQMAAMAAENNGAYTPKTYTAAEVQKMLDTTLAESLDQRDKKIIEHYRQQLNV